MSVWTDIHTFVAVVLLLFLANFIIKVVQDSIASRRKLSSEEGFEDTATDTDSSKDSSLYTWITDSQTIYDDFYAGIYDQLSNQTERTKAKLAILKDIWEKETPMSNWAVLDVGCGTGHAAVELAKMGAGRVVGLDNSSAMIEYAQTVVEPQAKLNSTQSEALVWRIDTLLNPSACSAGEFTHSICFYFSFYYIQDQEQFFRTMNLWTKPSGKLCIDVVNKYKFDPILESASPFIAFSVQKYSKERIMKSKVAFDKFDYEAEFTLTDPKAEFYETFRFKSGHVRRQKHQFLMPTIEKIVQMAKLGGWKYIGYQDLNTVGFEYSYLLTFEKS
jgi:ubiquinone/menaquinone biosynthesis C-methylase UbiE